MSTWWIGQSQLDKDQRDVIALPLDESVLITGPPGSGKTNLLLLRANYLYLAQKRNIAVVTFTRALRQFIASGANKYDFPASKITTCQEWQRDLIRQYDSTPVTGSNFQELRKAYLARTKKIVDKYKLENIFHAILLDEAQDYLPDEIKIFDKLSENLFCVADGRQKIYEGEDPLGLIGSIVDKKVNLRFHYRSGTKICKVADEIANKWPGYDNLAKNSNYDEKDSPAKVDFVRCDSSEAQIELALEALSAQITAFGDELIGIISPKRDGVERIWNAIQSSPYASKAFLVSDKGEDAFPEDRNIYVGTCHSAKGLEFRALHILDAEVLRKFGNNRRMTFTAVTRAKTSLKIYAAGEIHGYLDSAIKTLEDPAPLPSIDSIFGKKP